MMHLGGRSSGKKAGQLALPVGLLVAAAVLSAAAALASAIAASTSAAAAVPPPSAAGTPVTAQPANSSSTGEHPSTKKHHSIDHCSRHEKFIADQEAREAAAFHGYEGGEWRQPRKAAPPTLLENISRLYVSGADVRTGAEAAVLMSDGKVELRNRLL